MTGHIFLEGEIGDKVTLDSVRADIANYPQAQSWEVHIDSVGGDVDTGYAIGNILNNLKNTTAHIGALCASIATYAAHCCDKIVMGPSGDFTIHLPTGQVNGTAQDHRNAADRLDRIKAELTSRYMKRVARKGVSSEQVSAMLDKETSMSPAEALAMGFVDDVREKLKAVAKLNPKFTMEDTFTKEEAKGYFKELGEKIDKFFNAKFKNSVVIAMADGSSVTSDAATVEALVGSNTADPKGAPLTDGPHETADGMTLTTVGGKVTAYEPMAQDKDNAVEDLKKQVADLTAQLAASKTETPAAVNAAVAKTEAQFRNEFTALKKELEDLKTKTFGDDSAPDKDSTFRNDKDGKQVEMDPMAETLGRAYITSRQNY